MSFTPKQIENERPQRQEVSVQNGQNIRDVFPPLLPRTGFLRRSSAMCHWVGFLRRCGASFVGIHLTNSQPPLLSADRHCFLSGRSLKKMDLLQSSQQVRNKLYVLLTTLVSCPAAPPVPEWVGRLGTRLNHRCARTRYPPPCAMDSASQGFRFVSRRSGTSQRRESDRDSRAR